MRALHRGAILTLAGLSLACPGEGVSPADTSSTSNGSASSGDIGVASTSTGPGAPTSGDPGRSTDTTVNLDTGDRPSSTGSTGSSSTGSTGSTGSSSTGAEPSSSSGDAPPGCGDGEQDPGEACDDGNAVEFDGCLASCELGPGALVEQHPLPPPAMSEIRRCFTAIDQQLLAGDGHALVLGSFVSQAGPEGQVAAKVQQLRLPGLVAPEWAYIEWAGIYGRMPDRMITLTNGDVVVGGIVYTEKVKVDTGGYLWLARFTPDGEVVWSKDYPEHFVRPIDLELAPDGDLLLVGMFSGFGYYSAVLRFHDDGQLVWERGQPEEEGFGNYYRGLTLDDDGNIYVLGARHEYGNDQKSVLLHGLDGDGALLWSKVHPPPEAIGLTVGDLVWTADDQLVISASRYDLDTIQTRDQFVLAAFDTVGEKLWWKLWGTGQPNGLGVGRLLANDDGSVHAIGGQFDLEGTMSIAVLTSRFDTSGALLWALLTPGAHATDALHGPDGLLYVLAQDVVLAYTP